LNSYKSEPMAARLRELRTLFVPVLIAAVVLAGCGRPAPEGTENKHEDEHSEVASAEHEHTDDGHDHDHDHAAEASNLVPIPASVRENLGITFARAEMRRVASTLRIPGRFEARPDAVRNYGAPLAGRVELLVRQYEQVTTGTPLFRLDSAEWRRMQQEYVNAQAEVLATSASLMSAQVAREGGAAAEEVVQARIAAAEEHIQSVTASVQTAQTRLEKAQRLQEIVGGRLNEVNEARAQLASLKNELSQAREDRAELEQQRLQMSSENTGAFGTTETLRASATARRAEYEAARARRDLLLMSLKAINAGAEDESAAEPGLAGSNDKGAATWQAQPVITVRAASVGTVTSIASTSGAYLESASPVMTVVDSSRLRFRALAMQADLGKLSPEMKGRILQPAVGNGSEHAETIEVIAHMSPEADAERRTLDIVADVETTQTWARAGVSTDLELVLDETQRAQLAIPAACVIRDGLDKIFFRRNPSNPDVAIRVEADLGISDGKWVVVQSGAKAGDQVVLDGVYELKLATSGGAAKGVHVHPDGTVHEGED
jgi:multidrug resistance efflux pump